MVHISTYIEFSAIAIVVLITETIIIQEIAIGSIAVAEENLLAGLNSFATDIVDEGNVCFLIV